MEVDMKNVLIYSSDTWAYCKVAKDFLHENGVVFTEKNVSTDMQARQELMQKGFMGVPVIYVGEEVVHGFDKPKLVSLLGL